MEKVLLDTDVILDFLFDRKPFADFSATVLSLCEQKKIKGFVTPVIIANVYYLLRKTAKHIVVVNKIKQLLTLISVLEMGEDVVYNALNSNFKDFEDALQNFTAIEAGDINVILTRNIKDFKKSDLAIFTPEVYLKGIINQ